MTKKDCIMHQIVFIFALSFFFKPYYFTYLEITKVNFLYLNGLRFVFLIALVLYILNSRLSYFIIAISFFYLTKLISIFVNGGSILALITEAYPVLGICFLIELGLKKRPKELIEGFSALLCILIYINLIAIIIEPHGYHEIERVWFFLRGRNQLAPIYVLAIVMMVLRNDHDSNLFRKTQLWLTFIICTFMIFYGGSGSNILAWLPIMIYFILPIIFRYSKFINIRTYVVSYIVLFASVIVYNLQERYANLLYRLLGKDVTFSGRVDIWSTGIEMIKGRPLLGYGMTDTYNIIPWTNGRYMSAHNQFLQLMIEGGVLAMLAFFNIAYLAFSRLYNIKESEASKILSLGIFSIAIVLFSEAMGFFHMFILFAFAYNIKHVKANGNNCV